MIGVRSIYNEIVVRAKLRTLLKRRLQNIATLMYKVKNKLCPRYIADLFSSNRSGYCLRNADDFAIPRINT